MSYAKAQNHSQNATMNQSQIIELDKYLLKRICHSIIRRIKFYNPTKYAGISIHNAKLYNHIRAYSIPTNVTIKKW
jgi:hypothetical protein